MTMHELFAGGGCATIIIMSLIEISPVKINPWKTIARWFGRAINGDILDEINKMKSQIQDIDTRTNNMQDEARERDAVSCRTRILRFGDELLHDIHHSKEHFDQILIDINEYEIYCDTHPNFKNNQAVMTIKHIKAIYAECMKDRDFI